MGDKGQRKTETWHQNIYLSSQTRSLPSNPNPTASAPQDKSPQRILATCEETTLLWKAPEVEFWEAGAKELWNYLLTILLITERSWGKSEKPFASMPESGSAHCSNTLVHPVLLPGCSETQGQSLHLFTSLPLPIWEGERQGTGATNSLHVPCKAHLWPSTGCFQHQNIGTFDFHC